MLEVVWSSTLGEPCTGLKHKLSRLGCCCSLTRSLAYMLRLDKLRHLVPLGRTLSDTQSSLKKRCCAAQYGFQTSLDALTMFMATEMAWRMSLHICGSSCPSDAVSDVAYKCLAPDLIISVVSRLLHSAILFLYGHSTVTEWDAWWSAECGNRRPTCTSCATPSLRSRTSHAAPR